MDWEGETALHRAAEYGHLELVRLLISHGAEIERRDHSPVGPKTALHIAAHNGHVPIVEELLQNDANVTTRGEMGGPLLNFVLWQKRSISEKDYKVIDLVLRRWGYDIHSWLMEMGGTIVSQTLWGFISIVKLTGSYFGAGISSTRRLRLGISRSFGF
jgi:hypothetical protein